MSSNTHSFQFAASNDDASGLCVRDENGAWRPATGEEIVSAARRALARRVRRGTTMDSPHVVRDFLKLKLAGLDHEVFSAILLDARHRMIEYREMFRGTIDGATVYPREVVKEALMRNAAAVIFAHNHPSGVADPSEADRSITLKLSKALALVEIRVLDHLVVAGDSCVSFAERGLL
jgi:DNA repair protein RadC